MPSGIEKDEYLDASANMRTYINMRFAQLTLFVALTAGFLTLLVGRANPLSGTASAGLKVGGILIAVVFWVMEERAADFFHYYKRRAVELEKILGYSQYTNRPQRRVLAATNAVRLLFLGAVILWLLALFHPSFS